MSGYVYAIRSGDFVKIGFSKKPFGRAVKVRSDSPMPAELLGYIPGSMADERGLHAKFSVHHHHGEWFRAEGAVLAFLSTLPTPSRPKSRRDPSGIKLRDWRHEREITQANFAEKLGISGASVSRIETGMQWPDRDTMLRIWAVTAGEVTPNDIFPVVRSAA